MRVIWANILKLPYFIRKNRYGIYYFRYVVSLKVRRKYDDISKEIRFSLNTGKRREALRQACDLYADFHDLLTGSTGVTTKVLQDGSILFDGEKVDVQEYLLRSKHKRVALEKIKKLRKEAEEQRFVEKYLQENLTEEEKKAGLTKRLNDPVP